MYETETFKETGIFYPILNKISKHKKSTHLIGLSLVCSLRLNAINFLSCLLLYFLTGFTGELCEAAVAACLSQPCGASSICKDTVGGYLCFCAPGFIGEFREVLFNMFQSVLNQRK